VVNDSSGGSCGYFRGGKGKYREEKVEANGGSKKNCIS